MKALLWERSRLHSGVGFSSWNILHSVEWAGDLLSEESGIARSKNRCTYISMEINIIVMFENVLNQIYEGRKRITLFWLISR